MAKTGYRGARELLHYELFGTKVSDAIGSFRTIDCKSLDANDTSMALNVRFLALLSEDVASLFPEPDRVFAREKLQNRECKL